MSPVARKKIRNLLIIGCYISGVPLLRNAWLRLRYGTLARVICFHWVGPEGASGFEDKLRWLAENYEVVPLHQLLECMSEKSSRTRIAVTFDDGFQDLRDVVLPIIKRLNIPITVFVPSGILQMSEDERRSFATSCIGIDRPLLSLEEFKVLATDSLVNIQSHSATHMNLGSRGVSRDVIRGEIRGSAEQISNAFDRRVQFIAYPFGDVFNYSKTAMEEVCAAGLLGAFSIVPGFIHRGRSRFSLPRDSIDPSMPLFLFKAWLSGAYDLPKAVSNWGREIWARQT